MRLQSLFSYPYTPLGNNESLEDGKQARIRQTRWINVLFLFILGAYICVNSGTVPFHGDEAMQIYAANDYFTKLYRDPAQLKTQPPYTVDSDAHLRILNASVNRYAIGLALGMYFVKWWDIPFPPSPGWLWGRSYGDNVAQGYLPDSLVLMIARIPSLLFHIASSIMIFILARTLGGRPLAYAAALIFTLHPVLLLNGRRALQESEMIFFGLLTLWCAAKITHLRFNTQNRDATPPPIGMMSTKPLALWALLALACGLTLASKHSGIIFVTAATAWVLVGGILSLRVPPSPPRLRVSILRVLNIGTSTALVLLCALGVFIALSPALWNDPLARFGDLIQVHTELINIQTIEQGGATPLTERLNAIVTQPFLARPQFYEAQSFNVEPINESITAYLNTPFAGVHNALPVGIALTLLALVGVIAPFARPGWHINSPTSAWGLLLTLLIIVATKLINPLPWQRYYLPLTTIMCIYVALGVLTFMRVRTIWHDNRKQVMTG